MNISYKQHSTQDQDEKWLSEFKSSGNLDSLGELYKPYMPLVYGVALKYLKDRESSKDVVMQVFEILIDKAKSHEIANFRSWLYVLSRNHCLMILRKDKKDITLNIEDSFVETDSILHHDNDIDRENQLLAMEECIESLNDYQKQSIKLFYLQQKCYAEVADFTGHDIKKVKSYIQNGKRNLKICIEKNIG